MLRCSTSLRTNAVCRIFVLLTLLCNVLLANGQDDGFGDEQSSGLSPEEESIISNADMNLGRAYQLRYDRHEMLKVVDESLDSLKPLPRHVTAPTLLGFGLLLRDNGDGERSLLPLRTACEEFLDVDSPAEKDEDMKEACDVIGDIYIALGKYDEAIPLIESIDAQMPNEFTYVHQLAQCLSHSSRANETPVMERAKSLYLRAIELNPNSSRAAMNLGFLAGVYSPWNNTDAIKYMGMALAAIERGDNEQLINKVVIAFVHAHKSLFACDWNASDVSEALMVKYIDDVIDSGQLQNLQMFSVFEPRLPSRQILAISKAGSDRIFNEWQTNRELVKPHRRSDQELAPRERIRIGYAYSPGFTSDMPTTRLTQSVYGVHNRHRFEVYCYSIGEGDQSAEVQLIKQTCDSFVPMAGMDPKQVATRIADDGIHILIDLCGFAAYAVPHVFAMLPIPFAVQLHGYPLTMGANYVQYLIGDPITTPPEYAHYYTEKLMIHPSTLFATSKREIPGSLRILQYQSQAEGGGVMTKRSADALKCPPLPLNSVSEHRYRHALALEAKGDTKGAIESYLSAADIGAHDLEPIQPQATLEYRPAGCSSYGWKAPALLGAARMAYALHDREEFRRLRSVAQAYMQFGGSEPVDVIDGVDSAHVGEEAERVLEDDVTAVLAANNLTRRALGIPDDALVLCNFNAHWKYRRDVFTKWVNVLKAVPNAVLWLAKQTVADSDPNLHAEAAHIAGEEVASRVLEGGWAPWEFNLLLKGELCSIALDTPWFNGHTTSFEMSWAGIPLVTYPGGELFFSRLGASITSTASPHETSVELPHLGASLIARDLDEYQALVTKLLQNPKALAKLTNSVRAGRLGSGLDDLPLWTWQYEAGLMMWWDVWRHYGDQADPADNRFFHVIVNPNLAPPE